MHINELRDKIYQVSNLKGTFLLKSNKISNEYFDKYLFESDPEILNSIAYYLSLLLPKSFDKLAGLEMGGIPLVTVLSLKVGKPALFIRKQAKRYGTCNIIEGGDVKGKHVIIIEDVVTSGSSIDKAVTELRKEGAIVNYAYCVIDREEEKSFNIELISLFKKSEFR